MCVYITRAFFSNHGVTVTTMNANDLGIQKVFASPLNLLQAFIKDPASLIPSKWNMLTESIVAALFIIMGVVLKNTVEQTMKGRVSENAKRYEMLGMALFVAGWAMIADAVSRNNANLLTRSTEATLMPFLAAAIIVGAVIFMKQAMKKYANDGPTKMRKMRPLVLAFVAGWLLFALSFNQNRGLALVCALLVFASMLHFLPWQRKAGVIDGPGLPLFVFAWVGLIVANSRQLVTLLA